MPLQLTPQRAMLFRITHVDNLRSLLANGLHCANGRHDNRRFVPIGNPDLIDKRMRRIVPLEPGGVLADYIPFYFTPKSPMLLNIKTGWNGVTRRANDEIAILVSSWERMASHDVRLLFTDRHAYVATAKWSSDFTELETVLDWDILRRSDFQRSDDYPDKMERYQAEALAHEHVPCDALIGIACASERVRILVEKIGQAAGVSLPVRVRQAWYF
jgi:hypothetical protein